MNVTKIIDFRKKGNVVRFYLGSDEDEEYYGDDWDDTPYEHNAGTVYNEYVKGTLDVAFPFDWYVLEPADDWSYHGNSPYCKDDFKRKTAPCIVVVPYDEMEEYERKYGMDHDTYSKWIGAFGAFRIYFGDSEEKIRKWKYADELSMTWTQ